MSVSWTQVDRPESSTPFKVGVCLATDDKPIEEVGNGSQLMEMDTATLYLYDADNQTWRAWK